MGIDEKRAPGAGHRHLAVNGRRAAAAVEQACREAPLPQHRHDAVRVTADVRRVGGEVREGKQVRELAQDGGLVCASPGTDPVRQAGGISRRRGGAERRGAENERRPDPNPSHPQW